MGIRVTDIPIPGYEKVVMAEDPKIGFKSIIAVHDTTLGPALGGLRMWPYESEIQALTDVLRLSRGMTYKSAVARTGLGGGKSVIFGDPRKDKRPEVFRAMGEFVESLGGRYITAEDVGTSVGDMKWIREKTNWVTGRAREEGGSGDPSPFTSYGVFLGIKAFVEEELKRKSLKGVKVAVQGAGHVGWFLMGRLRESGCEVTVCDVDRTKVDAAVKEFGAKTCDPEAVYALPVDVFAPCALGAVVNDRTLPQFKCRVIAGGANNQLHEPRHGEELKRRGIAYAPDYVINAGGVINVSFELLPGGYDEAQSTRKVEGIYDTLKQILRLSADEDITTADAADRLAEEILEEGRRRKEKSAAKPKGGRGGRKPAG
jgi:leucine dehydrogenase